MPAPWRLTVIHRDLDLETYQEMHRLGKVDKMEEMTVCLDSYYGFPPA